MQSNVICNFPDLKRHIMDFNGAIALLIGHIAYDKHLRNVADSFNFLLRATEESDRKEVDDKLLEFLHKSLDVLFDAPTDNRLIGGIMVSGMFGIASAIQQYRKVPWVKLHAFTTKKELEPGLWDMMSDHIMNQHVQSLPDDYFTHKEYFGWWHDEIGRSMFVTPGAKHFFGEADYVPEHDGDIISVVGMAIRWLLAEKDHAGASGLTHLENFNNGKEAFYRTIPLVAVAVLVRVLDMRRDKKPDFGGAEIVCRIIDVLRLHAHFFKDYMDVVENTSYWFRLLNDKPVGSVAAVEFENVTRRTLGLPLTYVTKV